MSPARIIRVINALDECDQDDDVGPINSLSYVPVAVVSAEATNAMKLSNSFCLSGSIMF